MQFLLDLLGMKKQTKVTVTTTEIKPRKAVKAKKKAKTVKAKKSAKRK